METRALLQNPTQEIDLEISLWTMLLVRLVAIDDPVALKLRQKSCHSPFLWLGSDDPRMWETPRRADAVCIPGQKAETMMESQSAAMDPDSWPTGSLARLRHAVGMYVFGWANGCDPHHNLRQPPRRAHADHDFGIEDIGTDNNAGITIGAATDGLDGHGSGRGCRRKRGRGRGRGCGRGRGRGTHAISGTITGLPVPDPSSKQRRRLPSSSLRLINVKCRRESFFDVMSLDVDGSESDCSAIHCFKVFQRANVERGPPEQTNPRDIFLESIGNIVVWPSVSVPRSGEDCGDAGGVRAGEAGDSTAPRTRTHPLARALVICALDNAEGILAESDVPVEILPPNPATLPPAHGYCGPTLAQAYGMGTNVGMGRGIRTGERASTSAGMMCHMMVAATNAAASTSADAGTDVGAAAGTGAAMCTSTVERTRDRASMPQNIIQAQARPEAVPKSHSIPGAHGVDSVLRGREISNVAGNRACGAGNDGRYSNGDCDRSNGSGCVDGSIQDEQQKAPIDEKQKSAASQDEHESRRVLAQEQRVLQPSAIQLRTDERWRAQRQMIMQQQEQARAQMEACARACAQAGEYHRGQRASGTGTSELREPHYQSYQHQNDRMPESEQQRGQQRLRRLLRRKYLDEKRARNGWKRPQKSNSTKGTHIQAAGVARDPRANHIKAADAIGAGIGTGVYALSAHAALGNHQQGRDGQQVAHPQLEQRRRQPSQAESKTAAAQLAAVQAHLAAARAGQGQAITTPLPQSIQRPTTSPQWCTEGSKWLQCRVRAFFTPKGNVGVFSIDGTVVSWMRAQDNWGVALWHVAFDDGDSADLEEFEVADAHESFGAGPPPPLPFDAEKRAQAWRQRERRWAAQKKAHHCKTNVSSDADDIEANESDTILEQDSDNDLWAHDLLSDLPAPVRQSDTMHEEVEQQRDNLHAEARTFKCPDCGFEASKRNGLRVHRSRWCRATNQARSTAKNNDLDIAEPEIASASDKDSDDCVAAPSARTARQGHDTRNAVEGDGQSSDDCEAVVGVSRVRGNSGSSNWRVNMWDSTLRQTKYLGTFQSKRKAVGVAQAWRKDHGRSHATKRATASFSRSDRQGRDTRDATEGDGQSSDDCDDFVGVSRVRGNPGYWRVNMWDSKLRQTKYLGMFPSKRKAVSVAKAWRQKNGSDAQQQMSGMLRSVHPLAVSPSAQSTQQSPLARKKTVESPGNRMVSSPFTESDHGGGAESDECEICHGKSSEEGNQILLCDGCDRGFHQACYDIVVVPEGAWFCAECRARRAQRDKRKDTNPFRGVSIAANGTGNTCGGGKMWRAQIWYNGASRHLGTFADATVAAKIYDKAAIKYHGKKAVLNFPAAVGGKRSIVHAATHAAAKRQRVRSPTNSSSSASSGDFFTSSSGSENGNSPYTNARASGVLRASTRASERVSGTSFRLGDRVAVWWPLYKQWYSGILEETRQATANDRMVTETLIHYDDGDRDWENLTALFAMKPPQVRPLGGNQTEAMHDREGVTAVSNANANANANAE